MATESEDHAEWREEHEHATARFLRISMTAERVLLAHDVPADVAIERATKLVDGLEPLQPDAHDEPPFSDEQPETSPDPSGRAAAPPTPNASPPGMGQGMQAGFFPTNR